MTSKIFSATAIAFLASAVLALTAADASARGFTRSGSFTGPQGRGLSHSGSVYRSPGYASGSRSLQTNAGYGGTHSFERSCAGGTCSRSASTTTNSGRNWSRSGYVSAPGNGTANWGQTKTGPNGGSVSRSGSCASGACCDRNATLAGPNGNVWTSDHSAVANGHGGLDRSATFTGSGGTVTRSVDTDRYPRGTSRTITTTGPNGGEIDRRVIGIY